MNIKCLVVGQLQANCYLVWDQGSGEGVIIDPGDEGDFILQKISDLGFLPRMVLATHGHFDHILAATEIKLALGIPLYLHKADKEIFGRSEDSCLHFTGMKPDPLLPINNNLIANQVLRFGKENLSVIETPGHTPGSVCFYANGYLFSGDTLFKDGVGRTDFSYGSARAMQKSLKKIFKLPPSTIIYPGHGEETTIKKEIKIKRY